MEHGSVNFLSILIAAAAYMILGALWYSPILFGNSWTKGIGKTKEQIAADFSPMNYLWAFVMSFIASYGIARLMVWTGKSTMWDGIVIGLLAGVCFVMATMGVNDIFEGRSCKLTITNVLYHIVGFVVIGIIVGAM